MTRIDHFLYMDKTDYDSERFEGIGEGHKLCETISELERLRPCVKSGHCGIVKIKLELVEVVRENTYPNNSNQN